MDRISIKVCYHYVIILTQNLTIFTKTNGAAQHSAALACRHTRSTRRQSRARLLDMTEADTPFTGLLGGLSRFPIFRQVVIDGSEVKPAAVKIFIPSDAIVFDIRQPFAIACKTSSRWNTRSPTGATLALKLARLRQTSANSQCDTTVLCLLKRLLFLKGTFW